MNPDISVSSAFQEIISGFPVSIRNYRLGLDGLRAEPGAANRVKPFRDKEELIFQNLDKKITDLLLPYDDLLLTSWANWLRSCLEKIDVLDKNIPFIGKRQWSWTEVIDAMGFLEGIRVDIQRFLLMQGIDTD